MERSIRVVLAGGPASVADDDRIQEVTSLADNVKLPMLGGYEHFRHLGRHRVIEGCQLPVFEWCGRTKVAE